MKPCAKLASCGARIGRERRGVVRRVDEHDLRDAREARGLRGDLGAAVREHRDDERLGLEIERAAHALRRRGIEPRAVVLGDDEHAAHDSTPRASSAATSSATSLTRTPAARAGGGAKLVHGELPRGVDAELGERTARRAACVFALRISGSLT